MANDSPTHDDIQRSISWLTRAVIGLAGVGAWIATETDANIADMKADVRLFTDTASRQQTAQRDMLRDVLVKVEGIAVNLETLDERGTAKLEQHLDHHRQDKRTRAIE